MRCPHHPRTFSQRKANDPGIDFKVIDDPSIDTTSRTGKLVMGILALIAEFDMEHGRLEAQLRFFGSAFLVL